MLKVKGLSVTIDNKKIVDHVSFELKEHDIFMVAGPNGAGKTTLFKGIMGVVPHEGGVLFDNIDINMYKRKELARKIGVLTQRRQLQFAHTVYDVVSLGRYSHQKALLGRLDNRDREKIEQSLKLTGLSDIQNRSILTLSGGELQRVFLAQVFAQDPQILILDEPTTHLDLQYQIAIFDIIKEWVKKDNRAVLAVVHDLNTAYVYGNKAILMFDGKAYAKGPINEVLTQDNLQAVYNVDVAEWMKGILYNWK
ncbi:MAG: ABC transporter ATP-binding protein [Acetivibrionales bacterium]|jgi:iron complex transport system ATP-binding protein